MIRTIILDVDDTLLDSGKIVAEAYIEVAKRLGLRIPEPLEVEKLNGLPGEKMVSGLWPDLKHKLFRDEYQNVKAEIYKLFPGAVETISFLSKKGYVLGILTSREEETLRERLSETKLDLNDFRYISTTCHTKYHKPDPRVFEAIKKQLKDEGFCEKEVVYVGDAIYDWRVAKGAGIKFVAVLSGAWKKEEFVKEGLEEKYIINSIVELQGLMEKESEIFCD